MKNDPDKLMLAAIFQAAVKNKPIQIWWEPRKKKIRIEETDLGIHVYIHRKMYISHAIVGKS